MSIQAVVIMLGALGLLASSIVLVRLQLLSIRYGLGWIAVSLLAFVGAPVLEVLSGEVSRLGFTATGFSLGVVVVFLGLLCLQLSISLSGIHRSVQDLSENAALIEQRLRTIERAGAEAASDA